MFTSTTGRLASLASLSALVLSSAALSLPSYAASGDRDGLTNLAEFRHHSDPADEDTDNDGDDDGDEVHDGSRSTDVDVRDTDGDGVRDGDEDADHDGVDNEDEDDALEACVGDDGDRDGDHLADEDENDVGDRAGVADSDDDGVPDGEEDADGDGQSNEDDDDAADDRCGRTDEDDDDLLGPIVSFDAQTGQLVVDAVRAGRLTFVVTVDTEIEYDGSGHGSGGDATVEDLQPGTVVNEVDLAHDGSLDKVELARPQA